MQPELLKLDDVEVERFRLEMEENSPNPVGEFFASQKEGTKDEKLQINTNSNPAIKTFIPFIINFETLAGLESLNFDR